MGSFFLVKHSDAYGYPIDYNLWNEKVAIIHTWGFIFL